MADIFLPFLDGRSIRDRPTIRREGGSLHLPSHSFPAFYRRSKRDRDRRADQPFWPGRLFFLSDASTIMRLVFRSLLAYHSNCLTASLTKISWFSTGLGTSMSPRNRLVTLNSRALSVCVSPSFSQKLSRTRAGSRVLLLLSSSNFFATGSAIRRSAVQFSIRYYRVRRSHDERTPPAAVRLDARSQSLFGTTHQCRAAG
jgi:hypothetical protein